MMSTAASIDRRSAAPNPADAILTLNNIEVVYDHVILVLRGVSLEVPRGTIVALLGANGAGKTTTIKAISNLLHSERGEVTKGSIVFDGAEVHALGNPEGREILALEIRRPGPTFRAWDNVRFPVRDVDVDAALL